MRTKRIHVKSVVSSLFIIWVLMSSVISPITKAENKSLSPVPDKVIMGGFPFGTRIKTQGVLVVDVKEIDTALGVSSPARDAGIMPGDVIIKVNGKEAKSIGDVSVAISSSGGKAVDILILRNNEEINVKLVPVLSRDKQSYKSGLWIRDGAAGIGTVTCVLPDSLYFAGLGHGICDMDTGKLIPFDKGEVYGVRILGIVKGEKGKAGELHGQLDITPKGTLISNLHTGVFGKFNTEIPNTRLVEVGKKEEVKVGECVVFSTLGDEGVEEIEAQITKILDAKGKVKNFLVTITDKDFLEKTGGIIQGMSGSPIVQNGKLVGAVTHVLVNDPTKGYGIFIENMLAKAEKTE